MQYAMLIYEPPDAFASRANEDQDDPHVGAWRAYYRALVEAGIYVDGSPLHLPETGTTVRLRNGRREIQDGPYAESKEQLAGFTILELPSLDTALEWAARCPSASIGAIEIRPLAPDVKRRITE
ncbi:MAG: YciI family protein [Candidatus Binatia bacterium]